VTSERVARGDIQQIAFRAAYDGPNRHEAAARRRRRRNSFNTRRKLIRVQKLDHFLQSRPGLVRRGTGLESCVGNDVLLWRIAVLCGKLRSVGAIGRTSIASPPAAGLRQRKWNRADGEK